ncbi:MAG: hypothetical protein H7338_25525, partial [Candidatus Sericytochromatia bacterium]|nr:hypothetical protein [Candidatus Sericytochromatia bacterium]
MRGPFSPSGAVALIALTVSCQSSRLPPQAVPWPSAMTAVSPAPAPRTLASPGRTVVLPVASPRPGPSPRASPPAAVVVAQATPVPPLADAPRASPTAVPRPEPPPPASPPPANSAATPATKPATGVLFDPRWSATPIGREPPHFQDPADEPGKPDWLQSGAWPIVGDTVTKGVVWQANTLAVPPFLSFRVWSGAALPDRYVVTIAVRPISSPHIRPPIGEISLIPFYTDPTHYLEVVVGGDRMGVWIADGASPQSEQGWRGLHFLPIATAVGETRTVTMTVDRQRQTLTVTSAGQTASVTESSLGGKPAGVAIRAVGKRFAVPVFRIEALPCARQTGNRETEKHPHQPPPDEAG